MATYTLRYEEIDPQARPDEYKQLFSLNEQHVYGSSRLGVLNVNELLYETEIHVTAVGGDGELKEYSYVNDQITYKGFFKTTTRGDKTYELTNHLGNVMSTISDRKVLVDDASNNITYFLPDVDTYQDYFPFGMVMSERSGSESSAEYRFGFNGMEYENELYLPGTAYDFGARIYDGRIGRWFSVDPEKQKYPDISPFAIAINHPLLFIDPNGKEVVAYTQLSKDLVIRTMNYAFGENHGFSFEGNTLVHNGQTPEMSSQQALMFNYFIETVVVSSTSVKVFANRNMYDDINSKQDKFMVKEDGGYTKYFPSISEHKYSETQKMVPLLTYYEEAECIILITPSVLEDGINLHTDEGNKSFGAEHVLLHEFAHGIVQIIMNEMGGEFNGVNFEAMNETERLDWAIAYTNTLLGYLNESLETGQGQHDRKAQEKPKPSNVAPLKR